MAGIEELRKQLDEIDNQIVDLYKKRMSVCEEVGNFKVATGKKVFDRQREEEKLAAVTEGITDDFLKKGLTELFEQLMLSSRELQYQILEKNGIREKKVEK